MKMVIAWGLGLLAGAWPGLMASESTGVKTPVYCAHVHDRPSMPLGFRQPSGKRSERPV